MNLSHCPKLRHYDQRLQAFDLSRALLGRAAGKLDNMAISYEVTLRD